MNYLLSQIWICLLLTALVAGLAGWLIGRSGKYKLKTLEEKWRTKLARAENERDYYAGEVKNLSAIAEENNGMEERFAVEKNSLEKELGTLQKGMKSSTDDAKKHEEKLTLKANQLEEQNTSLNARVEEENQIFSQRLAELEAGEEHSKSLINEYEEKVTALQSQLDNAQINLTETNNQLTEVEAKLDISGSSKGKSTGIIAGVTALAGGAAAAVSSRSSSSEQDSDSLEQDVNNLEDDANSLNLDVNTDNYPVEVIEAITENDSNSLIKLGIRNTLDLLGKASNKDDILALAKLLGKDSWVVRSWASAADLLRVNGVNSVNAELLELTGVATVQSLSRSNVDKLTDSVKVIHRHVGKTIKRPKQADITSWIVNASLLEPMLETNVDKL